MVDEVLEYRKKLTAYVNKLRQNAGDYALREFAELRQMKLQDIKDAGIFFIDDPVEMLIPEYIDNVREFGVIALNNRPIYNKRYVIPIYDTLGYVMALVGYKYGITEKYMYATTKYFNRGDAVYGLQDIEYSIKSGIIIVVEGIMDAIRIKSLGFRNVIGTCGADKSWDRMILFNSIGKCLFIPDRDRAGLLTNKHWKCETYIRLLLPVQYKDIDELCKQGERGIKVAKRFIGMIMENFNDRVCVGTHEEIDMGTLVSL